MTKKNKNGDVFEVNPYSCRVTTADGTLVGVLQNIRPGSLSHLNKIKEIGDLSMGAYVSKERIGIAGEVSKVWLGPQPLREIIRDLIYLDMLKEASVQLFLDRNSQFMTEGERKDFMEKYSVRIDKDKVDAAKKEPGEKTAGVDDPKVNVPKHPTEGTEPFEKKPDGE